MPVGTATGAVHTNVESPSRRVADGNCVVWGFPVHGMAGEVLYADTLAWALMGDLMQELFSTHCAGRRVNTAMDVLRHMALAAILPLWTAGMGEETPPEDQLAVPWQPGFPDDWLSLVRRLVPQRTGAFLDACPTARLDDIVRRFFMAAADELPERVDAALVRRVANRQHHPGHPGIVPRVIRDQVSRHTFPGEWFPEGLRDSFCDLAVTICGWFSHVDTLYPLLPEATLHPPARPPDGCTTMRLARKWGLLLDASETWHRPDPQTSRLPGLGKVRWLAHMGTDLPVAFACNSGGGIVVVIPACLPADQADRLVDCAANPFPRLDLSPRAASVAAAPGAELAPPAIPHTPAQQVEQQAPMEKIPLHDLVVELTLGGLVFRSATGPNPNHPVGWLESGLASGKARSARLLILMAGMLKESGRARASSAGSGIAPPQHLERSRMCLTVRGLAYADLKDVGAGELRKAQDRVAHQIDRLRPELRQFVKVYATAEDDDIMPSRKKGFTQPISLGFRLEMPEPLTVDKDGSGTGQNAATDLARRCAGMERVTVRVLVPPKVDTDWLDVLVADGPEALRTALAQAQPFAPSEDSTNNTCPGDGAGASGSGDHTPPSDPGSQISANGGKTPAPSPCPGAAPVPPAPGDSGPLEVEAAAGSPEREDGDQARASSPDDRRKDQAPMSVPTAVSSNLPELLLPEPKAATQMLVSDCAARLGRLMAAVGRYFRSAGAPVRVEKHDGQTVLEDLKVSELPSEAESVARLYCAARSKNGAPGTKPTVMSKAQADLLLASPAFRSALPEIQVLARAPVLTVHRDRALVVVRDYDPESGILVIAVTSQCRRWQRRSRSASRTRRRSRRDAPW